jgi:hypothetical protein
MKLCSGSMNSRAVMNQTQGTLARRTPSDVLRQALVAPEILGNLQLSGWDGLLPEARSAGLLARLDVLLNERRLFKGVPDPVKPHLIAARRVASNEDAIVRWEVNRIAHALARQDIPIVLLKGAAYVMWELPVARGRFSSDVDILVPKASIANVERALIDHGWRHIKLDDYDQFFYRHWSHELSPLQHHDRGTIVDVHHTILPPTGRLHPDPAKLLAASVPLTGTRFSVLAPADMVLHSAAHAFQDGDLTRGSAILLTSMTFCATSAPHMPVSGIILPIVRRSWSSPGRCITRLDGRSYTCKHQYRHAQSRVRKRGDPLGRHRF